MQPIREPGVEGAVYFGGSFGCCVPAIQAHNAVEINSLNGQSRLLEPVVGLNRNKSLVYSRLFASWLMSPPNNQRKPSELHAAFDMPRQPGVTPAASCPSTPSNS